MTRNTRLPHRGWKHHAQRGATLIEAMAAGAVFAIGLLGLLAAQTVGAKQNWMASREGRATALAQDVLSTIRHWPYPDDAADALFNDNTANDSPDVLLVSGAISAVPESPGFEFNINEDDPGDFALPLPNEAIDLNEDGEPDFMRLLHVRPIVIGADTVGITVSVVVAWREDLGARQVVLPLVKYNPAFNLATIPGI